MRLGACLSAIRSACPTCLFALIRSRKGDSSTPWDRELSSTERQTCVKKNEVRRTQTANTLLDSDTGEGAKTGEPAPGRQLGPSGLGSGDAACVSQAACLDWDKCSHANLCLPSAKRE